MTSDRHVRSCPFLGGVNVYSLRAEGRKGAADRSHEERPRPLSHAESHCSSSSQPNVAALTAKGLEAGTARSGLDHSREAAPSDFPLLLPRCHLHGLRDVQRP